MTKVFRQICKHNNWRFRILYGKQTVIPKRADVLLFAHSLVDFRKLETPFLGLHIIRDPRDVIVSGYLYHKRTSEKWCVNTDFTLNPPIRHPQVPYPRQHLAEDWKRTYLASLGGKSYQANLLNLSQHDGLLFEMKYYGSWTTENMLAWDYQQTNMLEMKFEDLMGNFDGSFEQIFEHFRFSAEEIETNLRIASGHDLGRKSAEEIAQMAHVSTRKTSKWRDYFEPIHKDTFIDLFGDALITLGYEDDNDW